MRDKLIMFFFGVSVLDGGWMIVIGFQTWDQLLTRKDQFLLFWPQCLIMFVCLIVIELLLKKKKA